MILSKTALIYEIPPAILSTISALQQLPQSTLLETFSVSLPASPVYPENLHLSEWEEEGKDSCTVGIVTSKARYVLRIPVLPTDLVKMEVTNFPEIPVGQDGIEVETGDARGKPKAGAGSGFITQMILATDVAFLSAIASLLEDYDDDSDDASFDPEEEESDISNSGSSSNSANPSSEISHNSPHTLTANTLSQRPEIRRGFQVAGHRGIWHSRRGGPLSYDSPQSLVLFSDSPNGGPGSKQTYRRVVIPDGENFGEGWLMCLDEARGRVCLRVRVKGQDRIHVWDYA